MKVCPICWDLYDDRTHDSCPNRKCGKGATEKARAVPSPITSPVLLRRMPLKQNQKIRPPAPIRQKKGPILPERRPSSSTLSKPKVTPLTEKTTTTITTHSVEYPECSICLENDEPIFDYPCCKYSACKGCVSEYPWNPGAPGQIFCPGCKKELQPELFEGYVSDQKIKDVLKIREIARANFKLVKKSDPKSLAWGGMRQCTNLECDFFILLEGGCNTITCQCRRLFCVIRGKEDNKGDHTFSLSSFMAKVKKTHKRTALKTLLMDRELCSAEWHSLYLDELFLELAAAECDEIAVDKVLEGYFGDWPGFKACVRHIALTEKDLARYFK